MIDSSQIQISDSHFASIDDATNFIRWYEKNRQIVSGFDRQRYVKAKEILNNERTVRCDRII